VPRLRGGEGRRRPAHGSQHLGRHIRALCDRADIGRIRLHDLRHTCANLLLAQKRPPPRVMETLGHSGIAITVDAWSHVLPELQREVADRMDQTLNYTIDRTGAVVTLAHAASCGFEGCDRCEAGEGANGDLCCCGMAVNDREQPRDPPKRPQRPSVRLSKERSNGRSHSGAGAVASGTVFPPPGLTWSSSGEGAGSSVATNLETIGELASLQARERGEFSTRRTPSLGDSGQCDDAGYVRRILGHGRPGPGWRLLLLGSSEDQ
jgi:hypothetical protein